MVPVVPGESRTAEAAVDGAVVALGLLGLVGAAGVPAGLEDAGLEGLDGLEDAGEDDADEPDAAGPDDGPQPLRMSTPTDRDTMRPARPAAAGVLRVVVVVRLVACVQLVTVIPSWSSGAPVAPCLALRPPVRHFPRRR